MNGNFADDTSVGHQHKKHNIHSSSASTLSLRRVHGNRSNLPHPAAIGHHRHPQLPVIAAIQRPRCASPLLNPQLSLPLKFSSMVHHRHYLHLEDLYEFHTVRGYHERYRHWSAVQDLQECLFPVRYNQSFYQAIGIATARITLELRNSQWHRLAYIMTLGTHPHHRNRGLASFLLKNLLQHLHYNVPDAIELHVLPDNRDALQLYQRHGFEAVALEKDYYQFNGCSYDGVLLRCLQHPRMA